MSESRKLAAILVADVVGFSRLAGADEERTLGRLRSLRGDLIDPAIAAHRGRIVKRTGDGAIIEFRSAVDAVRCALDIQRAMAERNADVLEDERIVFRIGVHVGDIVEEDDGDLMGEGVNIAARLEGVCEPGGICLSAAAHEYTRDRIKEAFADLGEKALKNIARPSGPMAGGPQPSRRPKSRKSPKANAASRLGSPSLSCPSPISAGTRSRSLSSTA
jgi:adenylate cyclase